MAKKEQDIPVAVNESDAHPISAFVDHQARALQEAGRAAISLIPSGLRQHGWNALEESAKGFGVLVNAVSDGVNDVTKDLKREFVPQDDKQDDNPKE